MKKTTKYAWRILMAVVLVLSVAGCDDGTLGMPVSPDIMPPAPMIITFAATPSRISAGEQTTISWEVAGADEVQISAVSSTGEPVSFDVQTEDLAGDAQVTLNSTTEFVLTATKTADNLETEEGEEDVEGDEAAQKVSGGQIQFGPEIDEPEEEPSPSAAPAVSSVSQTLTVNVDAASTLTATIEARDSSVAACSQTVIDWTVNPSENVSVVVTADSGEAFDVTDQQCDGSIDDILGQASADPTPAVGCAVVAPCQQTTYTVTATDASGATDTASVTIDVDGDVTAKIKAGKAESTFETAEDTLLKVETFKNPVMIHWQATPDGAAVTVTASPSVTCDTELPSASTDALSGSASCTLTSETVFTIQAQLGSGEPVEDKVIVTAAAGAAGLNVADKWAFEGEQVFVEVQLTEGSSGDAVGDLKINGSSIPSELLSQLKSGSVVKVPNVIATAPNIQFQLLDNSSKEIDSEKAVQVIELVVDMIDQDEVAYTSLKFGTDGKSYAGVQRDGFHDGIAKMYVDGGAKYFNFVDPIKSYMNMDNMWNDAFFGYIDSYPVAVAVRESDSTQVFAGTTGALMFSQDGGDTWRNAMITRRIAGENYEKPDVEGAKFGDHLSCGRAAYGAGGGPKIQKGSKSRGTGDIISLNQFCDAYISKDGWAIVATDFGVFVEKNLDNNLDNDAFVWIGRPKKGVTQDELDNGGILTYGKIINAIEVVTDDSGAIEKVFAASAERGDGGKIYVSDDGGIHWKVYLDFGFPIYDIDYDSRNKKLYAASEEGIFSLSADKSFTTGEGEYMTAVTEDYEGLLVEPTISVAIDPKSPAGTMTVMAGTPTGIKMSRDSGANWTSLAVNGGEEAAVEALAISARDSGANVKYGIAIGSTAGQLVQSVTVGATSLGGNDVRAD